MSDIQLEKIASEIRYLVLKITHDIGSGHPTTCFSAVELAVMLYFKIRQIEKR